MNRRAGHTERIARFVTRVRLRSMPHEVTERSKEHLLDGLATMVGGAAEPASGKIRSYLARLDGKREATVLGSRLKLPCQHAALLNGVQGHVLDYEKRQGHSGRLGRRKLAFDSRTVGLNKRLKKARVSVRFLKLTFFGSSIR